MRKLSLLLPLLLIGCNSWEVETISTPYQPLESTDIQSDNSDLSNLITATHGYDIVTLGESSHQGSKVFSLRGRMVKALHQEAMPNFSSWKRAFMMVSPLGKTT